MNRKGGAMVEAALVFPIIVLSLMAIIAIMIFLFEEAASQAELHLVLRTEVGRQTGTFHGKTGSSNVSIRRGIMGIHSIINGTSSVTFEETRILPREVRKPLTGYLHLVDERKYARYMDFFQTEEIEDDGCLEKTIQ